MPGGGKGEHAALAGGVGQLPGVDLYGTLAITTTTKTAAERAFFIKGALGLLARETRAHF